MWDSGESPAFLIPAIPLTFVEYKRDPCIVRLPSPSPPHQSQTTIHSFKNVLSAKYMPGIMVSTKDVKMIKT